MWIISATKLKYSHPTRNLDRLQGKLVLPEVCSDSDKIFKLWQMLVTGAIQLGLLYGKMTDQKTWYSQSMLQRSYI